MGWNYGYYSLVLEYLLPLEIMEDIMVITQVTGLVYYGNYYGGGYQGIDTIIKEAV